MLFRSARGARARSPSSAMIRRTTFSETATGRAELARGAGAPQRARGAAGLDPARPVAFSEKVVRRIMAEEGLRARAPRELGADAAVAVGAPGRLEGGPDQGPQGGVRVGRGGRRQAVVERAARQGQRRQRRPPPCGPWSGPP